VKSLDNGIDQAINSNLIYYKVICFCFHKNNLNIGLSDKDQELRDKRKIPDFMEKEKSKSPTLPPKPTGSCSINYKKPSIEIPHIYLDQSQY
jgi:hypothetical protein